jgi:iron complex outermembrane receptor protein
MIKYRLDSLEVLAGGCFAGGRHKGSGFGLAMLTCAGLAVITPSAARAQSVDYGGLEQLFGEPVTTSATGKPQRSSEVPADMVIVTQDDIRRSGADNLPDILQFVTGIDIRRYSFGDAQIAIRGYDQPLNPRLLVLVDGRQIYQDIYGYVSWNALPVQLSEIRQIEIVKGPNSALFGFNAVSGVINIITFDPLLDNTNVLTLRGGTQKYGEGEAVATQHIGTTAGVRVSVGGFTSSGFSTSSTVPGDPPRYGSFNSDGRWQILPWLLLSASGGYTDDHTSRAILAESFDNADHLSYFRFGAAAETDYGTIAAEVYRNEDVWAGLGVNTDVTTTVAKVDDVLKVNPSNTIRVGFEFRENAGSAGFATPGAVSFDNYAVNGMWDWQITPTYEVTNAVRLDHLVLSQSGAGLLVTPGRTEAAYNSATITQPSFNSGLVVHLSDLDTLRVTAARGLQVPSLIDFATQLPVARGVYLLGAPDLQPEAVWNAEIGYVRVMPHIGMTAEGAVFFQRNTALLVAPGNTAFLPAGFVFASQAGNFGSSNEIGFELGLRGTTQGGFRWNGSYRYESISQDTPAGLPRNPGTVFDNGTPVHAIILGAGYTTGPWEMDIAGRFQTSFTDYGQNAVGATVPVNVPAYVIFNARIGYKVTDNLTLSGTAQQFNVTPLLSAAGSYIDRRFIAQATFRW